MTRVLTVIFGLLLGVSASATAGPTASSAEEPAFAGGLSVTREGLGARIEFTASAPTDCAVYVMNAQGKVVRHLAAGVLGEKAPEPLKPGLGQSLIWDGADDLGKPPAGGPFTVRVGLGLTPQFDKLIGFNPATLGSVRALASGPQGEVFVFFCHGTIHPSDNSMACAVLSREGKYVRTVVPYPASLPDDRLKGLKRLELEDGGKVPFIYHMENRSLVPGLGDIQEQRAFVTRDGRLACVGVLETPRRYAGPGPVHMIVLHADGGVPAGGAVRTRIHPNAVSATLAVSPDEKTLYASDVRTSKGHYGVPVNVVYRFGWDDKEASPFLGGEDAVGNAALDDPKGVTTDRDGLVYVADKGHDRVAAFKPDGAFVAALKVDRPERVEVHPASGAIYVLGGPNINVLRKFTSLKDPQPVARIEIPFFKHEGYRVTMTMDASAEPAVLWLGSGAGRWARFTLLRIEDKGDAFAQPVDVAKLPENQKPGFGSLLDVSLDRARERVYVSAPYAWYGAFDGRTGERNGDAPPLPVKTDGEGVVFNFGLDGLIYMQVKIPMGFKRYDPVTLKPLAFGGGEAVLQPGSLRLRSRGITADAAGNVYHLWQKLRPDLSPGDQGDADALGKWGRDGKAINTRLIDSDIRSLNSPCTDYAGNIYLLVGLRPGKDQLPPGLKGKLPEGEKDPDAVGGMNSYPLVYGSIVKFGPEGGVIRKGSGGVECNYNNNGLTTEVKGAKWIVPGASNVPSWRTGSPYVRPDICLCESPRFDVDGFGRSFYPDAGRFRVGVLDTNGNAICTFGSYGNQDSAGPGSAVPTPEIPLCWVQSVAVGDEAAYVGDRLNRRVVRVKLSYRAEEARALP